MAKSRFEYVKTFELPGADALLPDTWLVVRLDGRAFSRFTDVHALRKPNDLRGLALMNAAAGRVFEELGGAVVCAYGHSDEYSFVLPPRADLYGRRASKIVSSITSVFTAAYVWNWPRYFDEVPLQYPPSFDGRVVVYPQTQHLRHYLSWRQADAHINNQYNTCFWALVHSGLEPSDAQRALRGTQTAQKNELLFSRFDINYNRLPQIFRKGSFLFRQASGGGAKGAEDTISSKGRTPGTETSRSDPGTGTCEIVAHEEHCSDWCGKVQASFRKNLVCIHQDIIAESFWQSHSYLLD
ncbi:putative tRNA(His) guanylyltransferase [Porphyridium purpureum]|uniref:tRNA(His) guanylyltransferase n=1 Tax=Porphyridium purpureum TaxID=35688 RepID=A0A5J4Z5G5_PORPP|nr:putative tRNA(His) guanylyltransferase [Porphyridium purpureum]|eukprot:POR6327..scf295_1